MYTLLYINQQEILRIQINVDRQLLESLIGWELTRQITWAALIFPCLVGIFFTVNRLKERNSSYMVFLLVLLYLGSFLVFEYCVLKLIWSFQLTKKYEALIGTPFAGTDSIQTFLFIDTGALSPQGFIIVTALLGITATIFFQLPQFWGQKKAIPEEELVGKARELVEEKPEINTENLKKVKGIGPKMAEKLTKVGIKNLNDLANSDPQKVARAFDISDESASILINVAGSLIKAHKTSKRLKTE